MDSPKALVTSPLEEEDISRAGVFHEDAASNSAGRRGKQKQRAQDPFEDGVEESTSDEAEGGVESYPPTKDDEAEARRVAENLRRWEQAERERRKAARDSASSVASSSLVSDVTRRASLLWSGRRSKHASSASGVHQALRNSDDTVQLDDIENTLSPPATPTPEPDNPFTTPAGSTVSLNDPQHSAVMAESSQPSAFAAEGADQELLSTSTGEPSLSRSSSYTRSHPPPQPLDLPKPRTPPPRTSSSSPHASRPPEPIPPLVVSQREEEEEQPESRWWTDWLCGCRERGDNQTGRTNPFE